LKKFEIVQFETGDYGIRKTVGFPSILLGYYMFLKLRGMTNDWSETPSEQTKTSDLDALQKQYESILLQQTTMRDKGKPITVTIL